MAYTKTVWKPRKGLNLKRFEKSLESAQSVILNNVPDAVTEHGTPFSVDNMNKIEQGIYDAHEALNALALSISANYTYTHPASHPASMITQDANNRFVTDAEKAMWNNSSLSPIVISGLNVDMYLPSVDVDELKLFVVTIARTQNKVVRLYTPSHIIYIKAVENNTTSMVGLPGGTIAQLNSGAADLIATLKIYALGIN